MNDDIATAICGSLERIAHALAQLSQATSQHNASVEAKLDAALELMAAALGHEEEGEGDLLDGIDGLAGPPAGTPPGAPPDDGAFKLP